MKYSLFENESGANITVLIDGEFQQASSDHPNFNKIVDQVKADNPEGLLALFNPAVFASKKFEQLSDRVSIAGGTIYFDGDPVDGRLANQIVQFIEQDVDDWRPLVRFYERLMTNLNEHTRNELFRWISDRKLTISPDGKFYAYKGLRDDFTSIHAGPATVNGEEMNGNIPNNVGNVVTFPRSSVDANSDVACSTGLHAGAWTYARDFARGKVVKVIIDPVDVVSVPTDSYDQKLRVCKYVVVEEVTQESDQAVEHWPAYDEDSAESPYDPWYDGELY